MPENESQEPISYEAPMPGRHARFGYLLLAYVAVALGIAGVSAAVARDAVPAGRSLGCTEGIPASPRLGL